MKENSRRFIYYILYITSSVIQTTIANGYQNVVDIYLQNLVQSQCPYCNIPRRHRRMTNPYVPANLNPSPVYYPHTDPTVDPYPYPYYPDSITILPKPDDSETVLPRPVHYNPDEPTILPRPIHSHPDDSVTVLPRPIGSYGNKRCPTCNGPRTLMHDLDLPVSFENGLPLPPRESEITYFRPTTIEEKENMYTRPTKIVEKEHLYIRPSTIHEKESLYIRPTHMY